MTTVFDEQGRPEPPLAGDESATLVGFLEFQRATLAWKCGGLDKASMATRIASSTMTLAGLMKHLAWVEDYWFSVRLLGNPPEPYWSAVDWETDPDWEWTSAADDAPSDVLDLWNRSVAASRRHIETALTGGGLDQLAQKPWANGAYPSLRWILVHMVEEYSRHNGHADILRESIDGLTGE